MSAIFISHSSKDDQEAGLITNWLDKKGYPPVFLDHDLKKGIRAGENWEKVLYRKLKECQAVIVLCSRHSMASQWCFAEIALSRYEGKKIIPIIINPRPETIPYILSGIQSVDFSSRDQFAHEQLLIGLREIDIDERPGLKWDGRSPYPGLASYENEDELFFYGRTEDIQECQDKLRGMQRKGGKRFCMLIGASGCGKSSLMKAGIIPMLQREKTNLLVIDSFRPEQNPFLRFAVALSGAFERYNESHHWKEIMKNLKMRIESPVSDNNQWIILGNDLKASAKRLDSSVLICIDQFEEFFGNQSVDEASRFLRMLRLTLNQPKCPFMVICTLRSDFLAQFQSHPELSELEFETISVKPIPPENFYQIIEKPAELVGLDLDPGLAQVMVAESGGEDALPILAFTLREMWEKFRDNNCFTLRAYRERFGGINQAVAKVASEVIDSSAPDNEQLTALRRAFRMMVQINDDGQYVRQPVMWHDLPEKSYAIVQEFIDSRLVVPRHSGEEKEVEAAHDALFRQWDLLKNWMDDDREFLLWRKRLSRIITEWKRQNMDQNGLLSGAQLTESLRWLYDYEETLSEEEKQFISKSKLLFQSYQLASSAQRFYDRFDPDLEKGVPLAIESLKRFPTLEGDQALRRGLQLYFSKTKNKSAVIEKYARDFLKSTEDQDFDAIQTSLRLPHPDGLEAVAFSQDGCLLSTACHDGIARVWDNRQGKEVACIYHEGAVKSIAFNPQSSLLVTASLDHSIHIYNIAKAKEVAFFIYSAPIEIVTFSPDGLWVATGGWDKTVRLIETDSFTKRVTMLHDDRVNMVDFSLDSRMLISSSADHTACIWHIPSGEKLAQIQHKGQVNSSLWSPGFEQQLLATGSEDRTVCIWSVKEEKEVARLAHDRAVNTLCFSSDGKRLLTDGNLNSVVIWDLTSYQELSQCKHDDQVECLDYSTNGKWFASGSADCTARIWNSTTFREVSILKHRNPVKGIAFSPNDRFLATVGWKDYFARVWYFLPDDMIHKACSELKKDLSVEDWQRYFGDEPYKKTSS